MIKVLIIDDDKLARKGLISMVPWAECGMEIAGEAANGQKGMEFLETHEADLAVVDLSMPVMNGLEFIEKSRVKWPCLQYVVLSFYEDFQKVQAALRLGTLDYISKMRLEQQDCTEVFQRVGAVISAGGHTAGKERTESLSEPERLLETEWIRTCWLYSSHAFQELVEKTTHVHFPARAFEHLMVHMTASIPDRFDFRPQEVPLFFDIEAGVKWAGEFRNELIDDVLSRRRRAEVEAEILRVSQYLCGHLENSITIEDAAKLANLSRSYFASEFKRCTGVTFNHYLRRERVWEAQRLLREGAFPPDDVGQMVGYADTKYFTQIFAQFSGVTPSEYRKQACSRAQRRESSF